MLITCKSWSEIKLSVFCLSLLAFSWGDCKCKFSHVCSGTHMGLGRGGFGSAFLWPQNSEREWSWTEGQNRPVFLPSWMLSGRKTWGHLGVYVMKYKGRNRKRNWLYEMWRHSMSWFLAGAYRALNFCVSGNCPFLLDFKKGVFCQPVLSCWVLRARLECSLAKVRAAIKKEKKTNPNNQT